MNHRVYHMTKSVQYILYPSLSISCRNSLSVTSPFQETSNVHHCHMPRAAYSLLVNVAVNCHSSALQSSVDKFTDSYGHNSNFRQQLIQHITSMTTHSPASKQQWPLYTWNAMNFHLFTSTPQEEMLIYIPHSCQGLLYHQSAADASEDDEAQCVADLLPT